MEKFKPEGFVNIKGYKIPYYHNPKNDCGCCVCALANERISLEFFLGLYLKDYISKVLELCEILNDDGSFETSNKKAVRLDSITDCERDTLFQFFTNEELTNAYRNVFSMPNIKGE